MANGNPFYVEPVNILPGMSVFTGAMQERGKRVAEQAKEKQNLARRKQVAERFQTATPDQIVELSVEFPDIMKDISSGLEQKTKMTSQENADISKRILSNPELASEVLIEMAEEIDKRGGDNSGVIKDLQEIMRTGDVEKTVESAEKVLAFYDPQAMKQYRDLQGGVGGVDGVAGIKEFEYLTEGLSNEEIGRAKRVKLGLSPRASESAVSKGEKSFAAEAGKLAAKYKLEPQVAGAVTAAKNEAKALAAEAGTEKSNKLAWNVYDNSMGNLARAMAGTETGPFVGFIPAVTSNQQIAEGAVAVMAPVLKQMFRSAGEGIFTDKDQELLMKMVPTRKDSPEARVAKIKAIDEVVRSKLGMSEASVPQEITTQEEFDKLPTGAIYLEDGVEYRKQ